jgi:hypothetical protein
MRIAFRDWDPTRKDTPPVWKVTAEIQDASALSHSMPGGAFSVSKERFARTLENLDLLLVDRHPRGNAIHAGIRERSAVGFERRDSPSRNSLRANAGSEMHRLNRQRSRPTVVATQFVSKNGP